MKVRELQIFKLIKVYQDLFKALRPKIYSFSASDIENTPLKYRNYDPLDFGSQYGSILENLYVLIDEVIFFKDYLVKNTDLSIVNFDEDDSPRIINSSVLLDTYLYRLNVIWISILPMFSELYSNSRYNFEDLEYRFILVFLDIVPAISEILKILYSWHKEEIYKLYLPSTTYQRTQHGYFDVTSIRPAFLLDERFFKYKNPYYRDFGINKIIKNICVEDGVVEVLYLSLNSNIRYKNMVKSLGPKEAISCVLREILLDLDVIVLEFLGMNTLVDFEFLRNISKLSPPKPD